MDFISKSHFIFDFKLRSFAPHRQALAEILKLSLPTTLQNAVQSLSFVFLTALASSLGTSVVAATGSIGKFIGLGIMPSIAIGNSVSAMCAQNFGAGQEQRAIHCMKVGIAMNFLMNAAICLVLELFPRQFASIYNAADPEFLDLAVKYLRVFCLDLLFVPFLGNICGLCTGAGHTMFASGLNMLSSVVVRIPVCYVFGIVLGYGITGIGLGAPMASACSSVVAVIYYLSRRWRGGLDKLAVDKSAE